MQEGYIICSQCILDTTDDTIEFDERGVCNHCRDWEKLVQGIPSSVEREKNLVRLVDEIKEAGKKTNYDCIIGVSGGVDSTFVAYKVKELGLRPLAVHLDNGWNSELAVSNIEKMLTKLGIDLYTYVIEWEEFKDLQLSFLKASVPDGEIPTDHAILALMHLVAAREKIKYIIIGSNASTEAIMPRTWSYGHEDWRYINSVHQKFGTAKLKTFPHMNFWKFLFFRVIRRQREISLLNYLDYVKQDAMKIIEEELGWQYYGGKHYESIYTRFFQAYILPRKFNIDKRKAHLSNLICSGQVTREQALQEMKNDICPPDLMNEDRQFVIKKLGLTEEMFEEIMSLPAKSFENYPNNHNYFFYQLLKRIYNLYKKAVRRLSNSD